MDLSAFQRWPRGKNKPRVISINEYRSSRDKICFLLEACHSISIVHDGGEIALNTDGLTFCYGKKADFFCLHNIPIIEMKKSGNNVAFISQLTDEDQLINLMGMHFTASPAQCVIDLYNEPIDRNKHMEYMRNIMRYLMQEDVRRRDCSLGHPVAHDAASAVIRTQQFTNRIQSIVQPERLRLSNAAALQQNWGGNPRTPKARMRKRKQPEEKTQSGSVSKPVYCPPSPAPKPRKKLKRFQLPADHSFCREPFACAGIDQMHRLVGMCQESIRTNDADKLAKFGEQFQQITGILASMLRTHENPRSASLGFRL